MMKKFTTWMTIVALAAVPISCDSRPGPNTQKAITLGLRLHAELSTRYSVDRFVDNEKLQPFLSLLAEMKTSLTLAQKEADTQTLTVLSEAVVLLEDSMVLWEVKQRASMSGLYWDSHTGGMDLYLNNSDEYDTPRLPVARNTVRDTAAIVAIIKRHNLHQELVPPDVFLTKKNKNNFSDKVWIISNKTFIYLWDTAKKKLLEANGD